MNSTKKCVLLPYEKYLRLKQQQHESVGEDTLELGSSSMTIAPDLGKVTTCGDRVSLNVDTLLINFPKSLKSGALALLRNIEHSKVLAWNEQGELTVSGKAVQGSHIVDLVKDALVTYKNFEPLGVDLFYHNLKGIPLSLVKNLKRRKLLQTGGSNDVSSLKTANVQDVDQWVRPPPGMPDDKKKPRDVFKGGLMDKGIQSYASPAKVRRTKTNTWKELWQTL